MREILFKAKRIDNGEWVFGGIVYKGNKAFIVKVEKYIPDTRDWALAEYYEKNPQFKAETIEVDPETVCQYTEVDDKDENKIFEGDIVKDKSAQLLGVVKYSKKYMQFVVDDINDGEQDYSEFINEVKVIGNIFDNLELLEVKNG